MKTTLPRNSPVLMNSANDNCFQQGETNNVQTVLPSFVNWEVFKPERESEVRNIFVLSALYFWHVSQPIDCRYCTPMVLLSFTLSNKSVPSENHVGSLLISKTQGSLDSRQHSCLFKENLQQLSALALRETACFEICIFWVPCGTASYICPYRCETYKLLCFLDCEFRLPIAK